MLFSRVEVLFSLDTGTDTDRHTTNNNTIQYNTTNYDLSHKCKIILYEMYNSYIIKYSNYATTFIILKVGGIIKQAGWDIVR